MFKFSNFVVFLVIAALLLTGCQNPGPLKSPNPIQGGEMATEKHFDVVVYGTEPEGITAAVAAARSGLTVLLADPRTELGGLFTLGGLNFLDMNHGKDGTLLTQGIFKEFYDRVGGTAFDIEKAKLVFADMLGQEDNITTALGYTLEEVVMEGQFLRGIRLHDDNQEPLVIYGKQFIDASIDADLAAMAGAPYTFAGEDIGERDRQMGVTLVFILQNVDWNTVISYLKNDGNPHTGANNKAAWGYTEEGYSYVPRDPLMRLRGFNAARQDNGDVLINALVIFGVDALDPASKQEGIARAKAELEFILPYINEKFPGFEKATLAGTAEELYVRESRHILAEYLLTIDDVLEHRDHWDKVALASYPVDVQPTIAQRWGTIIGNPDRYAIPFRSLVPLEVENLMVVGKAAGYTSLAAGSARVVPIGMASAEAAGIAARILVAENMTPRELSANEGWIRALQRELVRRGAYLEDIKVANPKVMSHWAYEGVRIIRSLGLLDGGYENNYRLEEKMSKWRYQNLINKVLLKAGVEYPTIVVSDPPTNREFVMPVAKVAGGQPASYEAAIAYLTEKNIMTEILAPYFADPEAQASAAEVTWLVARLYEYLTNQ